MTIELRETEIATLIRKGLLSNDARNDLNAARNAFYSFLDKTLTEAGRSGACVLSTSDRAVPTISTTPGRLWERALSQQVASSRLPELSSPASRRRIEPRWGPTSLRTDDHV
jgi:hypothetical protein